MKKNVINMILILLYVCASAHVIVYISMVLKGITTVSIELSHQKDNNPRNMLWILSYSKVWCHTLYMQTWN